MNLFEALTFWNPWWRGESDWLQALSRDKADDIKELLHRREILTLTGVRRSGKTTILHLLINHLLEEIIF